jgi:hypothetical protein
MYCLRCALSVGARLRAFRGALNFETVTRYLPPTMEPVECVRLPRCLAEARQAMGGSSTVPS